MIIQKKILIIIVLIAFLCSGLAHSSPQKTGKVLRYIASLYIPADNATNSGMMTFGSELHPDMPARTFLK